MALGGRLMKKVTGKSGGSSQRAMEGAVDAGLRSHASNHSALSSSSSTASGTDSNTLSYRSDHQQPSYGFEHIQAPLPTARDAHYHPPHHRAMAHAPPVKPASSVHSGSSADSGAPSHRATPEILQKGYLLVKKGLLKGYEKRFYFLTTQSPDLYSCRDELQFAEWEASGLPVRKLPGLPKSKEGLLPTLVCPVLRADRAGDSSAFDRAIAVIAGDDAKCTAVKYLAPTGDACEDWIRSFHQVQIARRPGAPGGTSSGAPSGGSRRAAENGSFTAGATTPMDHASHTPASSHGSRTPAYGPQATPQPQARSTAATPSSAAAYGTPHSGSGASSRHSDVSDSPSHSSVHGRGHMTSTASTRSGVTSGGASTAASGNVLLFVPAAGSAISISDSKLQHAKQEMDALVAAGAKRPLRGGMENVKDTRWRYGPPEYVLSDLEYIKGKTRDADATPLESYAESCCQTFLMEATHKAVYAEWTSVRHEYFFMQVNDGDKIPGHLLKENDLFGLLYLDDSEVDMDGDERKDPRAVLAEAFTQGFPMEVLDVYTQPPQCHFAWRHWGRFTGRYRGVRGRGELIEIRGFGQMHIDAGRLMSLRLFFKQRDLFDQLNKATTQAPQSATSQTRTARQPTASSRTDAGLAIPTGTTKTAAPASSQPPPQQPRKAPSQVPSQSQQRVVRSDKLSENMDDYGEFNITAASVAAARAVASSRPHSSPASHDGSTSSSSSSPPSAAPPQAVKRTQLYQQFMPQGA